MTRVLVAIVPAPFTSVAVKVPDVEPVLSNDNPVSRTISGSANKPGWSNVTVEVRGTTKLRMFVSLVPRSSRDTKAPFVSRTSIRVSVVILELLLIWAQPVTIGVVGAERLIAT